MNKPITICEHQGDGSGIKFDNLGFVGNACEKATATIEEALGTVTTRTLKPEHARTKIAATTKATQKT